MKNAFFIGASVKACMAKNAPMLFATSIAESYFLKTASK